jgi:HAD superfamily phosphatase (TIGR01681 family)
MNNSELENINNKITYENSESNCHQESNLYLDLFIKGLIEKFRKFNNDEFEIFISNSTMFVSSGDEMLNLLSKKLKANKFNIAFNSDINFNDRINITCRNVSNEKQIELEYKIQNLSEIIELASRTNINLSTIIIMKIIAQIISKYKILYKAIILDLDYTLWNGTLAEDGIMKIRENLSTEEGIKYMEFMKFINTLAKELGIYIAICSKNDSAEVEMALANLNENIFPILNQIDYVIANNNDKSENILKIAEELSILPSSILFIDDNQIIRDEVQFKLPDVLIPEWSNHSDLITQIVTASLFDRNEISTKDQNRKKQFRIIKTERIKNSLPMLLVKVCNDTLHAESLQLYTKSNQFKFSSKDDNFPIDALSYYFEIYRENGEILGVSSTITFTSSQDSICIHNWAISCRYFDLGLEEFILNFIIETNPGKRILFNYYDSKNNLKVEELLNRYPEILKISNNNTIIELYNNKEAIEKFCSNTNLRKH